MKYFKRYLLLVLLIIINGSAVALMIKAAIGLSAYDAFNLSIAQIVNIKVGTIMILINSVLVFLQFLMLKKDFTIRHLLQIAVSIVFGSIVNIILDLTSDIEFANYVARFAIFLISISIQAIAIGSIMLLDLVTLPLEGFLKTTSRFVKPSFVQLRQLSDVLSIVFSLVVTFILKLPLNVREGTVIGMLLFSPLMGKAMEILEPKFVEWDLIDKTESSK